MRILYFDVFSGVSGDMTLGAFLDLGVKEEKLIDQLKKLYISGYKIEVSKKSKNGILGTDVNVIVEDEHHHNHENIHNHKKENNSNKYEHHHRSFKDIKGLIEASKLEQEVKDLSIKIFYTLAKAEGKIHGKPLEEVHFHEVGAIDSIVDIVGVAICLNELKIDKIISSPLNMGMGTIRCQHGIIPVPAPATLQILKEGSVPMYSTGLKFENVTPTGAAIIATLADEFSDIPEGVAVNIGYGTGKKDSDIANVLRLVIIEGKKKLQMTYM